MTGSEYQKLDPFSLPNNPLTAVADAVEKVPPIIYAGIGALFPYVVTRAYFDFGWNPPIAQTIAAAAVASLAATLAVFAAAAATFPVAIASIHAPFNVRHVAEWMRGSALGFADHAIATPINNADMNSRHSWDGPAADVALQDAITLQTVTNEMKDSFRDVQSPLNAFAVAGRVVAAGFLVTVSSTLVKLVVALARVLNGPALTMLGTIWAALKEALHIKGLLGWLLGEAAAIVANTLNTNFGLEQARRVAHDIPPDLGHGREGQPNRRGSDPVVWEK